MTTDKKPSPHRLIGLLVSCARPDRQGEAKELADALQAAVVSLEHDRDALYERYMDACARVVKLEAGLIEASKQCDHVHHGPKDLHGLGEPCPVEARLMRMLP